MRKWAKSFPEERRVAASPSGKRPSKTHSVVDEGSNYGLRDCGRSRRMHASKSLRHNGLHLVCDTPNKCFPSCMDPVAAKVRPFRSIPTAPLTDMTDSNHQREPQFP